MKIKNELKNIRGITLIALVITIIVLLILAGVTIATLTGDNGILTRANQAKEETEKARDKELIQLAVSEAQIGKNGFQELNANTLQAAIDNQFNERKAVVSDNNDGTFTVSCLDTLKDYKVTSNSVESTLDWDKVMQEAVAPESQDEERNEGVIGIGTDGKTVDMDLWEYTLHNGKYILNDLTDIEDTDGINETKGYLGNIVDGKIEGTVPQYIKTSQDKDFIAVTNMKDTFLGIDTLKVMPEIPSTITDMQSTFSRCTNLVLVEKLPSSVINMKWTFFQCSNLEYAELPCKVTNLCATFNNCDNLKAISRIPETVIDMEATFIYCDKLETVPTIPEKVENLTRTFKDCKELNGTIEINSSNLLNYKECFDGVCKNSNTKLKLTGTCPILNEIVAYTNNPNITL